MKSLEKPYISYWCSDNLRQANKYIFKIELSWKQTDAAKTREQLIQHQLQELHAKVEKLQAEASRAEGKT